MRTIQTASPLTDKIHCDWGRPKLTLEDLQGAGACLISLTLNLSTPPYSDVVGSALRVNSPGQRLLLLGWCVLSLIKCASSDAFQTEIPSSRVIVHILPHVYLYNGEEGRIL